MFSTGEPWVRQLAATLTVAARSRCVSQIPVCAVAGQPPLLEPGEGREAAAQPGDHGGRSSGSLRSGRARAAGLWGARVRVGVAEDGADGVPWVRAPSWPAR